ncbi:hypothetical protein VPH35_126088 [Triticum aestivum]
MMAEGPPMSIFPELVVCDPLHRRYILLPPVPKDLVASMESQDDEFLGWSCKPSLIPLSDEEAALVKETTFRVIWSACCKTNIVVFVFSSSTGQWQAAASQACMDGAPFQQDIAIVDAGEGRLGMFRTGYENASGESYLCYSIWQNKGESSGDWQMEKMSLGSGYRYNIEGGTENYLILLRIEAQSISSRWPPRARLKIAAWGTMQVERICAESCGFSGSKAFIYTNFPPSLLSLPTV